MIQQMTVQPSASGVPRTGPGRDGVSYPRQGRSRAVRIDLLDIVSVLWCVMPLFIFLAKGGAAKFGTLGAAFTSIGIVAGLVATATMAQQLLLASRIPVVDRALGHDRALARHRALTATTMVLLAAHGVMLMVGYGLADRSGPVGAFVGLWSLPDFVWAVLSFGLLCVVGLFSYAVVRARLPYELWHAIHLITYLAVLASIPHQFSMGSVFGSGWARWYWIAMWLVTGFAMLTWRILLPLFNSLDHRVSVVSVHPEGKDAVSIVMRGRDLASLSIRAGQFFHWRFLARGMWTHQHPFSLSAAPQGDYLRITVRDLGPGTKALMQVRPGTKVLFQGPYGVFSDVARTRDAVILAGAGAGIMPLRGLLEETTVLPGRALVILRASTAAELYLYDEVRNLCAAKGVACLTLTGRRDPERGWVPADHGSLRLAQLAPWVADADLFCCGPTGWTDSLCAEARAYGVPDSQIHVERFSW